MISQRWFGKWIIKQQGATYANVEQDLCHHIASWGHNEKWWLSKIEAIAWSLRCKCFDPGVIMGVMASQITCLTIVYSTVYSGADQRKHQSSASLAFVRGIHRWPVNSPHKGPVTGKMFPFDYGIINPSSSVDFIHLIQVTCVGALSVNKW